jgi:hypothetical protein
LNVRSGHMGNSLFRTHRLHLDGSEGVLKWLQALLVEVDIA